MRVKIIIVIAVLFCSCKTSENLYTQQMVKTEYGYKKIGKPKPHIILLGDTINVVYNKR